MINQSLKNKKIIMAIEVKKRAEIIQKWIDD